MLNAVFVGQGRLLIACAEGWLANGHAISAIISNAPIVRAWASQRQLTVIDTVAIFEEVNTPASFDYLFSVINHALLSASVLNRATRGAINFHDSLLPTYSGFNATSWAIRDGQTQHGVTWHQMSDIADSGDVLVQQAIDILPDDTAYTLSARCDAAGIDTFSTLLTLIETAAASNTPLPASPAQPRTQFRLRHERPGLGILDFNQSTTAISAQIRALDLGLEDSWMCRAKLQTPAGLFLVGDASIVATINAAPGTVCAISDEAMTIAAREGALRIERLTDLNGAPVAISALGVNTGDRIASTHEDQSAQEPAADAALSVHERFWVNRLGTLKPVEIPELRPHAGARDFGFAQFDRFRDQPALDAESRVRRLITALAIYVARTSEQTAMDFGLSKTLPAILQSAYAHTVPFRVACEDDLSLAELETRIEKEQRIQEKRVSYARDAVTRYRALRDADGFGLGPLVVYSASDASPEAHVVRGLAEHLALFTGLPGEPIQWAYDRNAISDDAFQRFTDRIAHILAQANADPSLTVSQFDLLTPAERETVLTKWQDTARPMPQTALIQKFFEQQAARTPDAVALVFGGHSLSYRELDTRANALAHRLHARGLGPDQLAGVCLNRSIEMVIALLAILKAGGAYVPMDPAYPKKRLKLMREDAHMKIVLTTRSLQAELGLGDADVLLVENFPQFGETAPPDITVAPHNLAYVIFTSGSTGRPKGVMVEHRNVTNFFLGMDEALSTEAGTWLATTSISFDISVLELFWTLGRGFKVVLQPEGDRASLEQRAARTHGAQRMDFSLFYFAATDGQQTDSYRLLIEGAKFADTHEFSAVWTPERHFHAFGGLFPNPALTSAALATITKNVSLRAGSVVLPLQNPIRVAEDWSLIDQLSGGRVGLSFASGWHANDFALMPGAYEARRDVMLSHIDTVKSLWRGEALETQNGQGKSISVKTFPRPVQAIAPMWITAAGNPDSFRLAGEQGTNLLTNMLGQDLADLKAKIALYRSARRDAGHEGPGTVTVMLHTFVCGDTEEAREKARKPFCNYLMSAYDLIKVAPAMFPAFRKPSLGDGMDADFDDGSFTDGDLEALMDHAFERYFESAGLFGTPQRALAMINDLKSIGVSEVACLVDFGIDQETVLQNLEHLDTLRRLANNSEATPAVEELTLPEAIEHYGVTHLQLTPTAARALASTPDGAASLAKLERLLVGGEALPNDLADTLCAATGGRVINMYGPTETTVWSTTSAVTHGAAITIGKPIANTVIRILDQQNRAAPIGVAGELCIGGADVTRGYLGRDDLTAARFVADPYDQSQRLYRTGDLARFLPSGDIDFIGRKDGQIKVNGYRIELGEIEAVLSRHPSVASVVVTVRKRDETASLAAYVIPAPAPLGADNDNEGTEVWQDLWESAYKNAPAHEDQRFNIAGWTGKLTGAPIARADMKAWLDETENRILALKPKRVLEIGCGTGMVLFRLLESIDSYVAIDVSPSALAKVYGALTEAERSKVSLHKIAAHALDEVPGDSFDTIVINSVAQYFPDAAYLERVIASAVQKLKPGGHIFIGDVRRLDALPAFHAAASLNQSESVSSSEQWTQRIAHDPELVLSHRYFHALRARMPGLTHVSTRLKQHHGAVELNGFRFDAVLQFNSAEAESTRPIPTIAAASLSELLVALNSGPDQLRVESILNARIAPYCCAADLLAKGTKDRAHLDAAMAAHPEAMDPGVFATLHPDYDAQLLFARNDDPARFDVLFTRRSFNAGSIPTAFETESTTDQPLANQPYRGGAKTGLVLADLRAHIERHLPAYMRPASITTLSAFPLTPNGKIDRNALPEPQTNEATVAVSFAAASTRVETVIADVWKALLGLPQLSVRENIFDMGANSLLAVQASQRISTALGQKVSLVSLFRYPTIEALAAHLDAGDTHDASLPDARAARQQSAIEKRRNLRRSNPS